MFGLIIKNCSFEFARNNLRQFNHMHGSILDVPDIRNEKIITDRVQRVKGPSYIVNDVFHDKRNSCYTVIIPSG